MKILWGGMVQNCYVKAKNLENDLLNKICVYENEDSLEENHNLKIRKPSLHKIVLLQLIVLQTLFIWNSFSSEQTLYRFIGYIIAAKTNQLYFLNDEFQ